MKKRSIKTILKAFKELGIELLSYFLGGGNTGSMGCAGFFFFFGAIFLYAVYDGDDFYLRAIGVVLVFLGIVLFLIRMHNISKEEKEEEV